MIYCYSISHNWCMYVCVVDISFLTGT
jgi:hypothetical protein